MRIAIAALCLVVSSAAIAAEPTVIDADAKFPEGPFVQPGYLFYAEYGAHRVSYWTGTEKGTLYEADGCGPSAVQRLGERWIITCYDNGTLAILDQAAEGLTQSVSVDADGNALVGPNDIVVDGLGTGVFVTTSGPWESAPIVGKVLHVDLNGEARVVADDLHYANGLALSAEGSTLFVNESEAGRVIRFNVNSDGTLYNRTLFVRLTDLDEPVGAYPDGIKLGPDGLLYIGLYSAGRIVVVDSQGALVRKYEVPSAAAPNMTFSEDGKTMYVMAVDDQANPPYAGKVYAVELEE